MSGGSANDEFDFDSAGDDGQDPFGSGFDDSGGVGAQPAPKSAKKSAKKSAEKSDGGVEPAAPLAPPTVALHIHLSQIRAIEKREPSTFDVMQVCCLNQHPNSRIL